MISCLERIRSLLVILLDIIIYTFSKAVMVLRPQFVVIIVNKIKNKFT